MLFQESGMEDTLSSIMQWGFIIIVILILVVILIKWILKKSFPSLMSLFYFAIPTYIVNTIIVASVGNETLNYYTLFEMPSFALYLSPPLVWDALFGMGMAEDRIDLLGVATFFIVFLPFWIALKSSAGVNESQVEKGLKWKKLISGWVIVIILGLGMHNFFLYLFILLIETKLLGLGLIFWIAIIVAVVLLLIFWKRRRDKNNWSPENDPQCQFINGEWVCPYDS